MSGERLRRFELDLGEVLQGEFRLGELNLLLVFQVNCPGCVVQALPMASRLYQRFASRGLQVLGLSTAFEDFEQNTADATRRLLATQELGLPVAFDRITLFEEGVDAGRCGASFAKNRLSGTPTWALLDAQAGILSQEFGHPSEPALVDWLEQRLGAASPVREMGEGL